MSDTTFKSPRGDELFSYLPAYYEFSRVIRADVDAKGAEMDALYAALNETLEQFFVKTATWGLERWEAELGIPTDKTKPIDQRRSYVESKLRGSGKVSGSMIKNVAQAYDGGEVSVLISPGEYKITVTFIGTRGIPANLDDLKAVMEEIKPAHMSLEYKFTYLTWDELDKAKKSWDQTDALNLTWDEWEKYRP
ncbi:YmfQ family protein [Paenibacillus cellulositrophicus]|uniref:YmfQ family protein n=1 Tax=Paenibacillus cellulositrophicus TaxID=562959 RepID=UPI00203FBCC3|nr:YmfQ family protein [Paenibacillus cellulositrophicus]MCM2995930.1 YmfQ family protein [Paenibacillus cellulositrophicus]